MPLDKLISIPVRKDWSQLPNGKWSLSIGKRGCRARVAQREVGGPYFAETWIPSQRRRVQHALDTTKRTEAKANAEAWLLKVHGKANRLDQPLTLRRLWEAYREGSAGYRLNTDFTQRGKLAAARRLFAFFGEGKVVSVLTRNDVDRYLAARSTGTGLPRALVRGPVRTRTAADDLCLLRTMVRWALNERRSGGDWLLSENPFRGVKLPKEESPRRPVVDQDHFLEMRRAARQLSTLAKKKSGKARFLRLELALVIAEATGARVGSIRGLRWTDIDHDRLTIRWDREFHKRRREIVVPITAELAAELKTFQVELGAIGDAWLFPRTSAEAPWPRELFTQLWGMAESYAGLPHQESGGWHMLRRKWAIERKHLPPVDVAGAGGWKDLVVLQTIYQIPTPEGMRVVVNEPKKLVFSSALGR